MPRTLKDFCQRACSQKIRRAPLEKKYGPHKSAVSVPSVSFSRDSTVYVPSVKFVVGPVLWFLYRPYFLFFNPPLATKVLAPPADNARLCPDGGLCRPSCCNPFVDQVLRPKTHKGGWKTKNYSYGLSPGPEKGSSDSWVAKFKGNKNSECKLSNGWSPKLQGDKTASFCRDMSGREVTGRQISIPIFHGILLPMDFWTPPRFLNFKELKQLKIASFYCKGKVRWGHPMKVTTQ